MKQFTLDRTIEALDAVVKTAPGGKRNPGAAIRDGHDSSCRYTEPDGRPSCIVGNLLAVTPGLKSKRPTFNNDTLNNQASVTQLNWAIGEPFDANAVRFLAYVQDAADTGDTWRQAVRQAKENMKLDGLL